VNSGVDPKLKKNIKRLEHDEYGSNIKKNRLIFAGYFFLAGHRGRH
jgi:hypothetical protein